MFAAVGAATASSRSPADMDLVSKPRSKSAVWLYFGLKADENGQPLTADEAICRLCRKIVLTKGGNTTNLRSHLKRRHRADFCETPSSTSAASFEAPGLDLNHEELFEDVPFLHAASNQNHVPDAVLPPGEPWLHGGPCRAVLSLPSCLCLCRVVGSAASAPASSGEGHMGEMKVYAKCHLQQDVLFGPYVGDVCRGMPHKLEYAWAIRDDAAFVFVDASDENRSSWMRYVTYTSSMEEHNLVVFQFCRRIYYRVSRPVTEGEELRVWIGKDYAAMLGLGMGDNMKCEVGDKETVLHLLQDIQLITLPEPNSSSFWSDHSQSQSPMPVISDVTTMSNPDAASDSGLVSGFSFPSSSLISLPSPSSHHHEKYDFVSGTEKLLSNPNAPHNSPWYFFGFEADPSGRPLDRSTAVCKLCGERVGCGGGPVELQNHLTHKHHIKPRDSSRERTAGQHRSAASSGLVGMLPLLASTHVTNAVTSFLVTDLQPPALVEGEGFKQLIHALLPGHRSLPSSCQLENLLKEVHAKGKVSLAHQLRRTAGRGRGPDEVPDHTAPLESETRRHPSHRGEVPHFVTLSVDVWFHSWQGSTGSYLTLWAHYIDLSFQVQNLALATRRLAENEDEASGLQAVEAQVAAMARQWGIAQPSMVLLGGEGRIRMGLSEGGAAAGNVPHPNSTTLLGRDDSASLEEEHCSEQRRAAGPPSLPCFFSAVQDCIEEVMSHPVIAETLSKVQGMLSVLLLPASPNRSHQHRVQSLAQALTKEERSGLRSWARGPPAWSQLFPVLSTLVKHRGLFCGLVGGGLSKEDASDAISSGSCHSASSSGAAPLSSDWKVLVELCLVLRPLDVACRTLAKETFPRLSLIKPILTGLLSRHLASRPGESSPVLREAKRMMRRSLASSYNNPVVNRTVCVACSLDPQFHGLGFMEEKERAATFDWLRKEAIRIVTEDRRRSQVKTQSQSRRSPSQGSPESEWDLRRSKRLKESQPISFKELQYDEESDAGEDDDGEMADPGSQAGLSGMEFLLGDLFSSAPRSRQSSVEESLDIEISVYRADRGASLGVEPLQWWRTKAGQFPLLATVARTYLAAPAVAGNAAQEFIKEGAGATSRKRANIPPESLDSILFLHYNHMPTTVSAAPAARNDDGRRGTENITI